MTDGPVVIDSSNLSYGWALAFVLTMEKGGEELPQLVVNIRLEDGQAEEDKAIRSILDRYLLQGPKKPRQSCETVAKTIFPFTMVRAEQTRDQLYERYRKLVPRLRRSRLNRRGTYFERMIMFKPSGTPVEHKGVNQLEKVIQDLLSSSARRSGLQLGLFDPTSDHLKTPYLGFPCLQQVAFSESKRGLIVTAFYPMQYLYERAYGNYLGLVKLGQFVAKQTSLQLGRVTCMAGVGKREISRHAAQALHTEVMAHIRRVGGFERLGARYVTVSSV